MANLLEKALADARQKRGLDPKPVAEAEEQTGKSFRVKCVQCGAVHRMNEDELEPWESDPETSQTDGDSDESLDGEDPDSDSDDDDEYEDRASALAKRLIAAANRKH